MFISSKELKVEMNGDEWSDGGTLTVLLTLNLITEKSGADHRTISHMQTLLSADLLVECQACEERFVHACLASRKKIIRIININ